MARCRRVPVVLLAAIALLSTMALSAGSGPRILIADSPLALDVPPLVVDGRVLVPVRAVFSALGAQVEWLPETRTILAQRAARRVELAVGSRVARVDGEAITLDVAPLISDGRTLIPLRFVAEAFGARVEWDPATETVRVLDAGTGAPAHLPPPAGDLAPVVPPPPVHVPTPAVAPALPSTPAPESKPVMLVGQVGGRVEAVAVQGKYAYVGVGLRLVVLDVSGPAVPREVGSTAPFSQFVEGVTVSGTFAFVAAGTDGLRIVDISDPARPVEVGSMTLPGHAEGVAVAGRYAFVADGHYGLRIVDLADPVHPVETASAYPLHYVFAVAVDGRYAYLAAAGAGLLVVDVADPAHPVELGTLQTPGYAYGVSVAAGLVYVAAGWQGLRVVDASDPADLQEVGFVQTPGWAFGVALAGSRAYVANALGGLQVFDVSDPTRIAELGGYAAAGGDAGSAAVAGGVAYVADRTWGLHLLDVSGPGAPAPIGFYGPLGHATAVARSGDYAYVAAATYGLRVVNVADPGHPVEVGAYDAQGDAIGVAVAGNYAYVAVMCPGPGMGLHVVDVSDPERPIRVGYRPPVEGCYRDIAVADGIAYVANEWGLELIDLADPPGPALAGYAYLQGTEWRATTGVGVSGKLAYVVQDREGVRVVDVSDPAAPALIGTFKDAGWTKGNAIAVAGRTAYITHHGGDGLKILDVSSPLRPAQAGSYRGPTLPERVTIAGSTAYVAFGNRGLHAVDVSSPSNPTLAFAYDTPGQASAAAVQGHYAYIADGKGGLLILDLGGGPSDQAANATGSRGHPRVAGSRDLVSGTSPLRQELPTQPPAGVQRANTSARTWVVTSTADSGPGSLRQATQDARTGDTITFDPAVFPPQDPAAIALKTNLPPISQGNLTIDASDAGVILDGSRIPGGGSGLGLQSNGNIIRGLQMIGFSVIGIGLAEGFANNVVGGDRGTGRGPMGQGNLVSGKGVGIQVNGNHNRIAGNLIGTDVSGLRAFDSDPGDGFFRHGIFIQGGSYNAIGGTSPGERNVISANQGSGIAMLRARGNAVIGNYIGTDVSGTADLGNAWTGVSMELGSAQNLVQGNLICGSNWGGVVISDRGSVYNTVVGNLIGTDATGTRPLGNRWAGVAVGFGGADFNRIGGTAPGEGNVISGNPVGVELQGTGNLVLGNLVGTDRSGKRAISNDLGIQLHAASASFVGGVTAAQRNVVSGNGGAGIKVDDAERSFVMGNYIGTDASGMVALPNRASGIELGTLQHFVIQGNLIAGNSGTGVSLGPESHFNHLRANRVGVSADGASPLPNGGE